MHLESSTNLERYLPEGEEDETLIPDAFNGSHEQKEKAEEGGIEDNAQNKFWLIDWDVDREEKPPLSVPLQYTPSKP